MVHSFPLSPTQDGDASGIGHSYSHLYDTTSCFLCQSNKSSMLCSVFPALWKSAEAFSNVPFTSLNPEMIRVTCQQVKQGDIANILPSPGKDQAWNTGVKDTSVQCSAASFQGTDH
ncbi:hypothetical protein E2C01_043107 [Portunus trituberculatus]|uniref:Uncharacterized protein n=1 Tax=Portunus trituberculatus TaxID=210409 RepID=A0A5B7FVF5_PORTR|nr:hypothetical protein [Portunus trituberculatus]